MSQLMGGLSTETQARAANLLEHVLSTQGLQPCLICCCCQAVCDQIGCMHAIGARAANLLEYVLSTQGAHPCLMLLSVCV